MPETKPPIPWGTNTVGPYEGEYRTGIPAALAKPQGQPVGPASPPGQPLGPASPPWQKPTTQHEAATLNAAEGFSAGLSGEMAGVVNAARSVGLGRYLVEKTLGVPRAVPVVGGEDQSVVEAYRAGREAIDTFRERTKKEWPKTATVSRIGAGLLSAPIIPGGPAVSGAIYGGISGLGESKADLTKGEFARAGVDTAVGLGVGAVTGYVAGKVVDKVGKWISKAPEQEVKNFTKDLAQSAWPTQQRRFATIQDLAIKTLKPDKEFQNALNSGVDDAAKVATARLRVYGAQTRPIYREIDEAIGKPQLTQITTHIDDEVQKIASDMGESGSRVAAALGEVKDDLIATAKAKYGDVENPEIPLEEVRRWVTGMIRKKFTKVGSLAETENYHLAEAAHEVADTFLKGWLKEASKLSPELAEKTARLTEINKKIATYARAEELLSHKEQLEFWKESPI